MDLDEEVTSLPSNVSAYAWVTYTAAILLSILFSVAYVRKFWNRSESDKSAVLAVIGISIALSSAFLLPVDVFLVSFMKNPDGSFKDWATNSTRHAVQESVTYSYYSIYGMILIYSFMVLPFSYFLYEEHDDDRNSFNVVPTAIIYTLLFLLVISTLLLAGAFIHYKGLPENNSTDWDQIDFVTEAFDKSGNKALAFVVSVLTLYGMLNIFYTSFGLVSFPITLIKGFCSLSEEESTLSQSQASTHETTRRQNDSRTSLSSEEIATPGEREDEERLLSSRRTSLGLRFFRIINATFGCIGILFSLLLFTFLFISNVDRLMNSLGYRKGYILKENKLQYNIMDYIMVNAQKYFPLDYVLHFLIVIFLVMCTVSGMRFTGLRCLWVSMFRVRPGRTPAQALIMLTFHLIFVVFAINVLMYSLIPQYTTFGSQNYCRYNETECVLTACSLNATTEECLITRAGAFVVSFAYLAWIFPVAYFWLTFVFLAAFPVCFIYVLIRLRQSSLEEAIGRDDFEDSDDHMIRT